jgi:hypothetical protein
MPEKIADLAPAPYNPRQISDEKLDLLRRAMQKYGDLSGIVFNRRNGHLVGGHQRVKHFDPDTPVHVERTYDEPTPQGTVAEGYVLMDDERWIYREVDWDDQDEAAANIAANMHGGEFVWPSLVEIVGELDAFGYDATLVGLTEDDLEKMLTGFSEDALKKLGDGEADGFADGEQFADLGEVLIQIWLTKDVFENSPSFKEDLDVLCNKYGVEWETRMKSKRT